MTSARGGSNRGAMREGGHLLKSAAMGAWSRRERGTAGGSSPAVGTCGNSSSAGVGGRGRGCSREIVELTASGGDRHIQLLDVERMHARHGLLE